MGFCHDLKIFIDSMKTLKVSRFKLQYTDLCILTKTTFLRKQYKLHDHFHYYKRYKGQTRISISSPSSENICPILAVNKGLSVVQEKYAGRSFKHLIISRRQGKWLLASQKTSDCAGLEERLFVHRLLKSKRWNLTSPHHTGGVQRPSPLQ